MKKVLLITLMILVIFTLVSCETSNGSVVNYIGDANFKQDVKDESEANEVVEDEESETKEEETTEKPKKKTMFGDQIETQDSVVFELEKAYYKENGSLIVEGYVVNVTDHVAGSPRLKKLELFNENNELIASESFGYLEENYGYVDARKQFEITLIFPSVMVTIKDDDLDFVSTISKFTSYHWD